MMNNPKAVGGRICNVKVGGVFFMMMMTMIVNVSDASSLSIFYMIHRKLAAPLDNNNHHHQSPSPAPEPSSAFSVEANPPVHKVTDERCSDLQTANVTKTCQHGLLNITACLAYSPTAPKELFLLVQNDGEDLMKVNVTILSIKFVLLDIEIPKHEAQKVTIPANVKGIPSVTLNAGNEKCVIQTGSPEPDNKFYDQLSSYTNRLSPIHGAYFLFLTALIVGGIWACYKLGKSDGHANGVQYQELEMGQPNSHSTKTIVETAEGWDERWDDGWEDKEYVKSSIGQHQSGNATSNGLASRKSDADEWGNDWED